MFSNLQIHNMNPEPPVADQIIESQCNPKDTTVQNHPPSTTHNTSSPPTNPPMLHVLIPGTHHRPNAITSAAPTLSPSQALVPLLIFILALAILCLDAFPTDQDEEDGE